MYPAPEEPVVLGAVLHVDARYLDDVVAVLRSLDHARVVFLRESKNKLWIVGDEARP
jgi:hypothetical protein